MGVCRAFTLLTCLLGHLSVRQQLTPDQLHIFRIHIRHQEANKILKRGVQLWVPCTWLVKPAVQPSLHRYNNTPSYSFSYYEWSLKYVRLTGESKRGRRGNGQEQEEKKNNNAVLWKGRLDSSLTSKLLSCMVAQRLGGFPNDIVPCAGAASTAATQPHCWRLWGITSVFNLLLWKQWVWLQQE